MKLSPLGFGAFKIGRNQGTKYAQPYELPSDEGLAQLLNGILDLGVNYIDTAPAYGTSEERIGKVIGPRTKDIVVSTKIGEVFEGGRSIFDFSADTARSSVARSRHRLGVETLSLVFIHSDGNDAKVLGSAEPLATMKSLRDEGIIRAIGFSGKTVEGARAALEWADAIMVEYHMDDRSHEAVIGEAGTRGVGVIVKKGLASGRLPANEAIRFVLANPHVTSMVVGGLSLDHMRENVRAAEAL